MVKKTRNSKSEKEETPRSYPKQPESAEEAGIAVGRAELAQMGSTVLYTLLKLKNVPGRSKIHSKAARVRALEGRVSESDLTTAGIVPPHSPSPKKRFRVILHVADEAPQTRTAPPRVRKPNEGERFEVPVCGIDVHADPLVAAIADPTGVIAEETFPYTEGGLHDLFGFLRLHRVEHVAMESTAEYWLRVFWALRETNFAVLVANPVQTKAAQGQKTDDYDAQRIALSFRDGRLKPSVLCTPAQFTRRKLNRDADKRTKAGAKAVCRLRTMYHVFDAPTWVADLHESQRGRRVLARCISLIPTSPAQVDDYQQVLTEEYAKGKGKVDDPAALLKMAAEMVVFLYHLDKCPGSRLRLAEHLEDYASNQRAAERLRAEVLRQVGEDPQLRCNYRLLLSIPGIGPTLALTILVEIADIRFFWSAKALAKWTGLAARVSQSGHRKRVTGHIYKGGNKYLREACYIAAKDEYIQAMAEGHPVGDFARRLKHAEKKPFKVAVTAGARHVLTYIYHVLTQQKSFEKLWAEQAPARVEANRQRKLRTFEKALTRMSLDDILPRVIEAVRKKCGELDDAEETYADLIREITGRPLVAGPT